MRNRSHFFTAAGVSSIALLVLLAGCTPEVQAALGETATTLAQNGADQVLTFAFDFARQLLAAFLF